MRMSNVDETKDWGVWLRAEDPRKRWTEGNNGPPLTLNQFGYGSKGRATDDGTPTANPHDVDSCRNYGDPN